MACAMLRKADIFAPCTNDLQREREKSVSGSETKWKHWKKISTEMHKETNSGFSFMIP
jgi:hypothetical protein